MRRVVAREAERLEESFSDVLALCARVTWDTMDEEQRDEVMQKVVLPRWGRVTSDGVMLKATKWAEVYGTTPKTIEGRYQRLRRSDGQDNSLSTETPTPIRRARSDLKKPGVLQAVMKDPELREAVEDEILREDSERRQQRSRAPRDPDAEAIGERADHATGLHHVAQAGDRLRLAVQILQRVGMTDLERKMLADEIRTVKIPLSFLESFAAADGSLANEIEAYLEAM